MARGSRQTTGHAVLFVPQDPGPPHLGAGFRMHASAHDAFLVKAGTGADQCTECADCEPKCPQNIPIIEMLAKAHAYLTG